jgi:hypothetical protein
MTKTTIARATLGMSVLMMSGCGGGDSGASTATAPTGSAGSGYFTCQGTGQLRYVGTFTVDAPNPTPFP